jgi:hypothetical protein
MRNVASGARKERSVGRQALKVTKTIGAAYMVKLVGKTPIPQQMRVIENCTPNTNSFGRVRE